MAKSVTVQIGADTKNFISELKKADKEINKTQKTANALAKSLEYKYDAGRATRAQKMFQDALKQTEEQAEKTREKLKQLEKDGKTDTPDYSALELELVKVEKKAVDLKHRIEEIDNIRLNQITDKFKNVGDKITAAGQKLTGLSLAAAGAIAGAAALGKQAAATGAEIDDMTQRFGISAETIQRWNYLSMQAGVESSVFTKALIRARAAMADLTVGTNNAAVEVLQNLGIAANEFGSDEEMFDGIVSALSKVEDKTLQTAYANEIFGDKIATQLLPYINAGAEDLAKWNAEFDAMPSLTGEEAAALALLDDTFNRLNATMKYATAQLGLAFAPIIERVVEWIEGSLVPAIENLAEWFENLSPGMQDMILGFTGILAVAAPLLMIIGRISSGIGALIPLLSKLRGVSLKNASAIGAIFTAIYMISQIIENWEGMNTIQKIIAVIGTLTAVALGAAIALGAFHSAWSLGLAVAGIAAGIASVVAAVNAAKNSIEEPQIDDFNADEISNGITNGSYEYSQLPNAAADSGYYSDNSYSSNDTINVTVNGTNLSAEEIARAVSKEIATLKQSRR